MNPGLTHYEMWDCQVLFRSAHEQLMRKAISCVRGEKLFGIPPIQLDVMKQIGQQLDLLQRLYCLYSDVNKTIDAYHTIYWRDADIGPLQEKLMEFSKRLVSASLCVPSTKKLCIICPYLPNTREMGLFFDNFSLQQTESHL